VAALDEPRATKQIAQPSESGPFENERVNFSQANFSRRIFHFHKNENEEK